VFFYHSGASFAAGAWSYEDFGVHESVSGSKLRLPVHEERVMPIEDEREQAVRHAARLKGLALVRTGDTFALAVCTDATLEEIADFLAARANSDVEHRRADLRAMLRAERALIAELEAEKRKTDASSSNHATPEAALAEIRRRIAEIQRAEQQEAPGVTASI
jgi:hypothetical protein